MEAFFQQVIEFLPDALFLLDSEGKILFLNPAAEKLTATSNTLLKNRPFQELFPKAENILTRLKNTLKTGHAYTIREDELANRAREAFVVEIHIEGFYDSDGKQLGAILLMRDLSALKKMEEDFRYADRLAIMGTIASGLAHEIKNPLGGIKGAAQMLSREVEKEEQKEYLEIIVKEANRVNKIIQELLHFTKPKTSKPSAVNLNKLLDELVHLEQESEGAENVRFLRHYDPSLPNVKADESQLKQVFLNLIKNAREAVHENGTIELSTRLVTGYQLKVEEGKVARMIQVDIHDDGCGMSEETLSNLFAPFYTTKKAGTGLGLAISHRIITEHHGFIQVQSQQDKGTTFSVFLRAIS